MKVAVMLPGHAQGGVASVARDLAEGLAAHGDDVRTIWHEGGASARPNHRSGHVQAPPRDLLAVWWFALRNRSRVGVLHLGTGRAGVRYLLAARLAGMRRVFLVAHGTSVSDWRSPRRRRLAKLARAVVIPSALLTREARALGLRNAVCVQNGVRPPAGRADREKARARLGVREDAFVVVSAGRLVPAKGFDQLITAVAKVEAVELLIAGDGELREGLERQAAEQLPGRAGLLGWLDDLSDLYATGDLFALASHKEAFPLVHLEAAGAGLPSVGWDIPAMREVVLDGETGLLVPEGDVEGLAAALARLRDDAQLRGQLGARARERARRELSLEAMVGRYEALLRGRR